ncbi:MAG: PTS sugar transporter subunit IIA [Clostridium sp.]|nr:PTS sugar transporter subunit IIA [Clostridium sp.]
MTKEVIKKEYIFTGVELNSKEEALRAIAEQAVSLGLCRDVEETYQGFMEREAQGPTGMEDGFAIPHTRCESVIQTGIVVMKSNRELEWESFDGKPVHIMIALIVPKENYGNEHIQILASLSRMLMKQDFRRQLTESDSPEEIYQVIHQAVSAG